MPFKKLIEWLEKEKILGCESPDRAVLATATSQAVPHSRVVAIREISPEGVLFFTQRGTRKFSELMDNPSASMTFWFSLQQREVMLDGVAKPLSTEENNHYWKTMPHDRQLRFSAYAPISGQQIASLEEIDNNYKKLASQYDGKEVVMSEFYCGFRLIPETFYFYTLGGTTFSEVIQYKNNQGVWQNKMISP